jgi:ribokinase
MAGGRVCVLGSFVADAAFRTERLPEWGETLMGNAFALGPGGKGSNQAVAAVRAGAQVQMLSKVGDDAFGKLARDTWAADGIDASLVANCETPTGAAAILIDEARGENAIVVVPGACFTLTSDEVEDAHEAICGAQVLLTQLELPLAAVERGLRIAREGGVVTILNPAPAQSLSEEMLGLVDILIPNESEAAALAGFPVETMEQAERAARVLQQRGARNVILTLGERGALVCERNGAPQLVPSFRTGKVLDTTGAGDAFCGAFAAALSEGMGVLQASRFGCAGAGISVTRAGAAPSMPRRIEIEALMARDAEEQR